MYKALLVLICLFLLSTIAIAEDNDLYLINKDIRILAFVGKPASRVIKPVLYYTAVKQYVTFYHGDSGPGLYAFYLKGLIVRNEDGKLMTAPEGFFVVKKRLVKKYE